jgi:hypothetical protein
MQACYDERHRSATWRHRRDLHIYFISWLLQVRKLQNSVEQQQLLNEILRFLYTFSLHKSECPSVGVATSLTRYDQRANTDSLARAEKVTLLDICLGCGWELCLIRGTKRYTVQNHTLDEEVYQGVRKKQLKSSSLSVLYLLIL